MDRTFRFTALVMTVFSLGLAVLNAQAITKLPLPNWTSLAIAAFFVLLATAIVAIWRARAKNSVFIIGIM